MLMIEAKMRGPFKRTSCAALLLCAALIGGLLFSESVAFAAKKKSSSASDVLNKARQKYSSISRFQADTEVTTKTSGSKSTKMTGKIYADKQKNQYRSEITTKLPSGSYTTIETVNKDGKWKYDPFKRKVEHQPRKYPSQFKVDTLLPVIPDNKNAIIEKSITFKNGKQGYVVTSKTKSSSKALQGASGMRVFVEKDTSLIRRVEYLDSKGRKIMSTSFNNIRINEQLPKGVFNFQVPPDTEVVESKKGKVTLKKTPSKRK